MFRIDTVFHIKKLKGNRYTLRGGYSVEIDFYSLLKMGTPIMKTMLPRGAYPLLLK